MYLFLEILNILHVLSKSKLLCKEGEIFGEDLNFAILVESFNQQCIFRDYDMTKFEYQQNFVWFKNNKVFTQQIYVLLQ